jgi:hypothetical protein
VRGQPVSWNSPKNLVCFGIIRVFQRKTTAVTRDHKYAAFRALHERSGTFVIPNPWNARIEST